MKSSCELKLLNNILPQMSIDELYLAGGLNNCLFEYTIANKTFYFPLGRSYTELSDVLKRLKIKHYKISIEKLQTEENLFNQDDTTIIVAIPFLPKSVNLMDLKIEKKYFFNVFTTMIYKKASDDYGVEQIKLTDSENNIVIMSPKEIAHLSKLDNIFGIDTVKVYSINNEDLEKTTIDMSSILQEVQDYFNKDYIVREKDGFIVYKGRYFYQKMREIIIEWEELTNAGQILFTNTLTAGSPYFYRAEFIESLFLQQYISETNYTQLELLKKKWRNFSRVLKKCILQKHMSEKNREILMELIEEIENREKNIF